LNKLIVVPACLLTSVALAASIFATLYTARVSDPDLRAATGNSDATLRWQAANLAYREQVVNKTAVPQKALMKIVYVDGAIEMATVTSPLFSDPLNLAPGTLRRANTGSTSLSFNDVDSSGEYQVTGHWMRWEIWTDGRLLNSGWHYQVDGIEYIDYRDPMQTIPK
jgi:hypothetical protein